MGQRPPLWAKGARADASPEPHLTRELLLLLFPLISQNGGISSFVELGLAGKGKPGNPTGKRKERPRQKSVAGTLPAPVTGSAAQASSQSIREGRSAPLPSAASRGPAPSPAPALAPVPHFQRAFAITSSAPGLGLRGLGDAGEVTGTLLVGSFLRGEERASDHHPPTIPLGTSLPRAPFR